MSRLIRAVGPVLVFTLAASLAPAATQEEINAAIAKGAKYLKQNPGMGNDVGPKALVGLALLEAGTPVDDPTLRTIAATVRDASFTQNQTYHVSLSILFLDRYGDPADVPLIQMLGARLLFGQSSTGGWSYNLGDVGGDAQVLQARLKGARAKLEPGKVHPDVSAYMAALAGRPRPETGAGDNSNTQFAVLAVWVVRKHGVPCEAALDLATERFLQSQSPNTGGWPYSGAAADSGSPSMTCAGLLGLATGIARREERLAKIAEKKVEPPKEPAKAIDPVFTPVKPVEKAPPKRAPDRLDFAAQRGLAGLGVVLANSARMGQGRLVLEQKQMGHDDLYFFWSLERVGVVYGLDRIGGVDWYAAGAESLVRAQAADGSWSGPSYNAEVSTAFALLFLTRSNVVRDLSQKVQRTSTDAELRATGPGGASTPVNDPKGPTTSIPPRSGNPASRPVLPLPVEDESGKLAAELLLAPPSDWNKKLDKLRDAKGGDYTRALVLAIPRLEGEQKKAAREALAERLTRMTPETLRGMMKSNDPELRRGAVLAAAMKDDKAHVPDLIERLTDDEELVVRAARAGLKSLSNGKDFGPPSGATKPEREASAKAWRDWWAGEKK